LYPPNPDPIPVAASPASIPSSRYDTVVLVDVVPCVINLPSIVAGQGRIIVKDRTGNATSDNPISLVPAGGQTVEANAQIRSGFATFTLYGSGTVWSIL
jgi:hypothetical protein